MDYYADIRFLISLYVNETTTAAASSVVQAVTQPLPLIPLGFLELRNALYVAVFRKQISEGIRRAAWEAIDRDIRNGIFTDARVDSDRLHAKATELADKHSTTVGIRTLDLIHIAAAILLGAKQLLSFDNRQQTVATHEGPQVLP